MSKKLVVASGKLQERNRVQRASKIYPFLQEKKQM